MSNKDISRLCQAVLPAGFDQARRDLPRIQTFLEENLPDAVCGSVTILSVTPEQIVIAANTPLVTNYLRLHGAEIQQQLRETFQLEQALKFRTIPDAIFQRRQPKTLQAPRAVSRESVAVIRQNAQWIEDAELRAAMLALADSLSADSKKPSSG